MTLETPLKSKVVTIVVDKNVADAFLLEKVLDIVWEGASRKQAPASTTDGFPSFGTICKNRFTKEERTA